jgi:hypothetical protein
MVDWTCPLLECSKHFIQDDITSTSLGGVCMAIYTVHLEFMICVFVQRVISLDLGELGILIRMS